MKTIFFLMVALFSLNMAMAQENNGGNNNEELVYNPNPVVVNERMVLRSHDTDVIPFNRFMRIDRILIEAKTPASCSPSNLVVSVDGYAENRKNVWIPSNLVARKFIVEMNGYSGRTLQIENDGGCRIIIKSIKILPRRPMVGGNGGGGGSVIDPTDITAHVMNIVDISQMLTEYVTPQEVVQYLSPLRKLGGKAVASINATGLTSTATRAALVALVEELKKHEVFIDRLISSLYTQDLGYQLMEAKVAIERSLL